MIDIEPLSFPWKRPLPLLAPDAFQYGKNVCVDGEAIRLIAMSKRYYLHLSVKFFDLQGNMCYSLMDANQYKGDMNMLHTFKAQTKTLNQGLQVQASTRNFKLVMDEPRQLGGTDQGMSPVEAVLCALGGCQAIVVRAYAKAQGLKIDDFHVDIEGDLDLDGFMHKADVRLGFQEIRFTMHFKTDEPQDKVEKFVEFIENTCPVGDTIGNSVKLVRQKIVIE